MCHKFINYKFLACILGLHKRHFIYATEALQFTYMYLLDWKEMVITEWLSSDISTSTLALSKHCMPMMPTSYFITFYYFDIGAAKTLIPAVNVCLKKCLKMFENLEHQAKCPAGKSTFPRQQGGTFFKTCKIRVNYSCYITNV